MSRVNSRRRNYFIKKSFQSSFAMRFAALIGLEALLIAILFFYKSQGTLTTSYAGNELHIERTSVYFFTTTFVIVAIAAVMMAIVGMLVFIVLSHRIAGPAFRLQKSVESIRQGDLTNHISLRRKDELGDLAEDVNRLSKSLDEKLGEMKREIVRAKSADASESREALKRLEALANTFKTSA